MAMAPLKLGELDQGVLLKLNFGVKTQFSCFDMQV